MRSPLQRPSPQSRRESRLLSLARSAFGRQPDFLVRAPGRVNLLGEHTDYNMLPVLPMAIERSVLVAGRPRDDRTVTLKNLGGFAERHFELVDSIPSFEDGDWGNYVKAAAQGLTTYCGAPLRRGADLMIEGNIPSGAGLSSSSALVVASALALLAANDAEVGFETLAEILPKAERYVGTLSGGMDQTVSLLARAGYALRIDFSPLRHRAVPLSPSQAIVVCHSMVQAEKSKAAKQAYNQRVIECRLACRLLERSLNHPLSALGDLVSAFPGRSLASFVDDLVRVAPETSLDLVQIAAILGGSERDLCESCEIPADHRGAFKPLARARHVLNEAERVDRAEAALHEGDARGFGELMDSSHRSCRDDYEISCAELETLVEQAKRAGALGARLTGAGFGGCTVNLVPREKVDSFIEHMDTHFYGARLQSRTDVTELRFVFAPQAGAEVRRL